MSPQQIEQQTKSLINQIVRDEIAAALGVVGAKALAEKGPLPNTRLDDAGTVTVAISALKFMIKTSEVWL